MPQMLLEAENKLDLKPFAQIARKQGIIVRYIIQKEKQSKKSHNPSPSGDTWFDDPKNLAYLKNRIEASKTEKHYVIGRNQSVREFFDKI
ncbi:MAG: hypothetical protein FWE23_06175 [Chitinivibrionia bacterium]|nr:hypothetical protein [Chitinivibrionia bacterium]